MTVIETERLTKYYGSHRGIVDVDLADVRRERISLPLLRDERPELVAREFRRLVAERAGLAADETAEVGSTPGFDVAVDP